MFVHRWRDRPNVLARLVPKTEIRGFFKKDTVINPGEAAVIISGGKIEDVVTQTKLKKMGGGFKNWLERKVAKETDKEMIFLVTTPEDLHLPINFTSKDHVDVKGVCTVRIQFSPEEATKLINLLKRDKVITTEGLAKKLHREMAAMVFGNTISRYPVKDFHSNIDIIKDMETTAMVELRKTFNMYGITLLKLFTNFKKGAYDRLMEYKSKVEMAMKKKDIDLYAHLEDLRRAHEFHTKKIEDKWDLRRGEVRGKESISTTHLDAKIERDKMAHDHKLGKAKDKTDFKLDSKKRAQMDQLDVRDRKRQDEIKGDEQELAMAMKAKEQLNAMKMARTQQDLDFKMQQMESQSGMTERIMSQAVGAGAADSNALQEMLRQQTMAKALDRDGDKVKSLSEAEKARFDKQAYMEAEDREREHTTDRMKLDAQMMDAAKQNVPKTLIQGGGGENVKTQYRMNEQVGGEEKTAAGKCPKCGMDVQSGWKLCPGCGAELKSAGKSCPSCGNEVQAGWKMCPNCGTKLGGKPTCPSCGNDVQAGWKMCPNCGTKL